jgi:hypothetical protein
MEKNNYDREKFERGYRRAVLKSAPSQLGAGCGTFAAVMLFAIAFAFAARFGWALAEGILTP